jgi:hypothetical protein
MAEKERLERKIKRHEEDLDLMTAAELERTHDGVEKKAGGLWEAATHPLETIKNGWESTAHYGTSTYLTGGILAALATALATKGLMDKKDPNRVRKESFERALADHARMTQSAPLWADSGTMGLLDIDHEKKDKTQHTRLAKRYNFLANELKGNQALTDGQHNSLGQPLEQTEQA